MTLENIIGQEKICTALSRLIETGRLSHAYLFLGPKGSLKKEVAFAFSRAILSSPLLNKRQDLGFSEKSLALFQASTHPDFHLISPEGGQIKIKQIRALKERLAQYEKFASRTVVLIEEADLMGLEASNAFLKTLEEPLGEVHFILLSSSREKLLDTIFSRVQTFYFAPLSKDALKTYAKENPRFQKKTASEQKLFLSLAFGSKAALFDLLENEEALFEERDRLFDLLSQLSLTSYGKLALFVHNIQKRQKEAYVALKKEGTTLTERQHQKESLKKVFFLIESYYQDLFSFHYLSLEALTHMDKLDLYQKTHFDEKAYPYLIEAIYDAYEKLEYNTDYHLVFLVLLITLKNKLN